MKILRTFNRVYASNIDSVLQFYEKLTNKKVEKRFSIPYPPIEMAYIDNYIIVSGSENDLDNFRKINITCIVNDLNNFYDFFIKSDAKVLSEPKDIPTGKNMTICHSDGLIAEYVQVKTSV